MCVLHRCDNPSCVRPTHLFLGTKIDNNLDCRLKGRLPVGEKHYRASITEETVKKMRSMFKRGRRVCEIADLFKLERRNAWQIIHRLRWKHI
jgi:hypothetical protein